MVERNLALRYAAKMLTTRVVKITEHVDKLWPLLEAHRRELATHPDIMPLEPRLDVYRNLENEGRLLSLILEDVNAGVVGYSINILSNNLHYGPLKVCQNDVLFVSASYRSEGGGNALMRATEINAREDGCRMMLWHAKQGTALDRMLRASPNYDVQDIVYGRVLY